MAASASETFATLPLFGAHGHEETMPEQPSTWAYSTDCVRTARRRSSACPWRLRGFARRAFGSRTDVLFSARRAASVRSLRHRYAAAAAVARRSASQASDARAVRIAANRATPDQPSWERITPVIAEAMAPPTNRPVM